MIFKQLRMSAKLTQQYMADACGWNNRASACLVEAGKNEIGWVEGVKWANACGKDVILQDKKNKKDKIVVEV